MSNKQQDVLLEISVLEAPSTKPKILIDGQDTPIDYEASNQLHTLECIKIEVELDKSHQVHIAYQLINSAVAAFSTEYPTLVHFAIVREALRDEEIKGLDRHSNEYKDIVILVAKRLNDHLHKLKMHLAPPEPVKSAFEKIRAEAFQATGTPSALEVTDWSEVTPEIDSYFEKNGSFYVDERYLKYLKTIGSSGSDIASELEELFSEHYHIFKETGRYPLDFWFNLEATPSRPIFFSPAWKLLAKSIWRDEVMRKANLRIKGVPAIIEHDQRHITELLSNSKEIIADNEVQVISNGSLLGKIPVLMLSKDDVDTVLRGIRKMHCVEGHRVLRYVPRTAFNQAVNGDHDYRVIRRDSFSDIADEIGLKSRKSVTSMAEVFQTMAYFDFQRPNFSGNLITLRRFKSSKTHRLDGVEITVGTSLLPYRACENFKNGESTLLIPLLPDPVLVGSNQYHAGQYLLQMLVMGEFVRQSVDFANHGYVKITKELWQRMAAECSVLPILDKIIDRWTRDGDDGFKFLEKIEGDFFTLGPSYKKEAEFLVSQGNIRIAQSKRGKASYEKRLTIKK